MSRATTRESARVASETLVRVDHIEPGVFFTDSEPLPRGRHGLARHQVEAIQRERLMVATTELLADRGYAGFGAPDVAREAKVSLAAFYDVFENKQSCVFAGYDRFIHVLLNKVISAQLDDLQPTEIVDVVLGTYLTTLQSDVVVARAYQVEIDALGFAARKRRRESLELFADHLRALIQRVGPALGIPVDLPRTAYLGVVYAARQIASDALDDGGVPDFPALHAELLSWMSDLFRSRSS